MIEAMKAPWCKTPRRRGFRAPTSLRSPSSVSKAPRSFASLNQSIVPRIRVTATLAKAIDNAAASQVIRRQLDPHAVAEHEPDAVPLHPSAQIAERLVPVVELN